VQRELQRGRIDVVRGLAEVDVVVRVDESVLAATFPRELEGAVRDHLVGVHVRRRAGAALDHVDHEVLVVAAGANLLRGADDEVGDVVGEEPEVVVRERGGLLDRGQRGDERGKLSQGGAGDREVLERAQGLDSIHCLVGHLAIAKQIVLDARHPARESHRAAAADERRVGAAQAL
jgi:hypothetical protein